MLVQASEECRKQGLQTNNLRKALTKLKEERASLLSVSVDLTEEWDPPVTGREFLELAERLLHPHRQKQLN